MGLNDLPALGLIRARMAWLTARHATISDNIAQSARPGFVPRDLAPFAAANTALPLAPVPGGIMQAADARSGFATLSRGQPVSLETEAAALAETSMDYQVAATLYSRSFRLLKTALGKR
jgi:flagellar basal-body rod protein FlgB